MNESELLRDLHQYADLLKVTSDQLRSEIIPENRERIVAECRQLVKAMIEIAEALRA